MNYTLLEKAYASLMLDPDFTKLELLRQKPNIFSALRIVHYENRHSNFLGWLMDPNQTHGLGAKFLKWVLSDIFQDERVREVSVADIASLHFEKSKVYREWNNIDLLISMENVVVVFENKIRTGEHSDQLNRYKNLIDQHFGTSRKVFVFLSPNGTSSSMNEVYVNYSYYRIVTLLERLIGVHRPAILPAVLIYIEDYIETIKANFMSTSETNVLARKIYGNHSELFDFIFRQVPNPLKEITTYLNQKIGEFGWKKCTSERAYIRFLTPRLDAALPRNGTSWKHESFLFEFYIQDSSLEFYYTIGPGDDATRKLLKEAVEEIDGVAGWEEEGNYYCYADLQVDTEPIRLEMTDKIYLDNYLEAFWTHVLSSVKAAEAKILTKSKELAERTTL
jgi:hypothetical protein